MSFAFCNPIASKPPAYMYTGNLWLVWPIDCNVKYHIFQNINLPYTQLAASIATKSTTSLTCSERLGRLVAKPPCPASSDTPPSGNEGVELRVEPNSCRSCCNTFSTALSSSLRQSLSSELTWSDQRKPLMYHRKQLKIPSVSLSLSGMALAIMTMTFDLDAAHTLLLSSGLFSSGDYLCHFVISYAVSDEN